MMQKPEEKNKSLKTPVAPLYQTPRLTVYGAIKDLTAGGSGSLSEPEPEKGNQPPDRRP
jgi:hypothetical protein